MADSLRVQLGKKMLEGGDDGTQSTAPWPASTWIAFGEALARGEGGVPIRRWAIALDPESVLPSAEAVKEQAGLDEAPEVLEAKDLGDYPFPEGERSDEAFEEYKEIKICQVDPDDFERMRDKIRFDIGSIWLNGEVKLLHRVIGWEKDLPENVLDVEKYEREFQQRREMEETKKREKKEKGGQEAL